MDNELAVRADDIIWRRLGLAFLNQEVKLIILYTNLAINWSIRKGNRYYGSTFKME